jgi:hypothetical protein
MDVRVTKPPIEQDLCTVQNDATGNTLAFMKEVLSSGFGWGTKLS